MRVCAGFLEVQKLGYGGGLMLGISVPLLSITLVRTTSFSIYESSKRFYGKLLHHPLYTTPQLPPPGRLITTPPYQGFFGLNATYAFMSGFTSGAFITILACPFEFTKLATQIELLMRRTQIASSPDLTTPTDAKGPMQVAKEIYSTRGFRGLYSGFAYHFGMSFCIVVDELVMLWGQGYISLRMRVPSIFFPVQRSQDR
jgi:hypothetical protein